MEGEAAMGIAVSASRVYVNNRRERFQRVKALNFHTRSGCKHGYDGEFDPGSGQTLAAYLRHASRTGLSASAGSRVADG